VVDLAHVILQGWDKMLYYFAALMAAALILGVSNPRSEINRWAAVFLGFAAIGGLTDQLKEAGLQGWASGVQFLNLTMTPYGVVIFCLVYSELMSNRKRIALMKVLLFIPVGVTLAVTPVTPHLIIDYTLLLVWAGPYYLGACCLLVASLQKESNRSKRRNRVVTTLIIVPTLVAVLVFIYLVRVIFPSFEFFSYVSYFLIYSFVVAMLCLFVYGVLGVRLRIERDPLDNAMKAVTTGANLLNHTIKNEIGKIAISSENLKRVIAKEDEQSWQHLQIISDSSEHMLAMIERIHSRMKDIVLKPQHYDLDELVKQCVEHNELQLNNKGISVSMDFKAKPIVLCDAVHLKEALGNLLVNAVEAMPNGGAIAIVVSENKKGVALSVEDNGAGIEADSLAHVLEPFYSTKNNKGNFGLGLSYVYNVMRKSGGSVDITSEENRGTTITLYFPRNSRKPQ
jgi:signal transduction histidine kinase